MFLIEFNNFDSSIKERFYIFRYFIFQTLGCHKGQFTNEKRQYLIPGNFSTTAREEENFAGRKSCEFRAFW